MKTTLLLCALVAGVSGAWAQDTYELVTDVSSLADGSKIIIADGTSGSCSAIGGANNSSNRKSVSVTVTSSAIVTSVGNSSDTQSAANTKNDKITLPYEITLVKSGDYWYLKETLSDGDVYLNGGSKTAKNGNNNHLKAANSVETGTGTATANGVYSITINASTKVATIKNKNSYYIQKNSSSAIFATYYSAQKDVYIYKKADAAAHTLTSAVSPASTGTVTLGKTSVPEGGTTTITATANDGYRFVRWTVTGTGASVAADTDAETTFTMGTEDAMVTATFEAIPTHTLSYTVSPAGAGEVTLSAASVCEGYTATATAAANAGYRFAGWSIADGDKGASLSSDTDNPTTVTMGTADATLTATFDAVVTYEVRWSVNGTIVKTENVEESTAISFAAPESGVPSGYTFTGWVTEANKIDTPTDTEPTANYVTAANSTADVTYYAVMAVGNTNYETATLTASHTKNETSYASHTYTDDKSNTWSAVNNEPYENEQARYGLTNTGTPTRQFTSPEFPGNIIAIALLSYNGSGSARTFYVNSEAGKSGDLGTIAGPANTKLTAEQRATLTSSNFKSFVLQASGALGFSYIKVTYTVTSFSGFCTTVPTIPVSVTGAKFATFSDHVARDFSATGITVYAAKSDGSSVRLTEVTDGIVPANTGVVLYSETVKSGVAVPATATDKTELTDNEMVGINVRSLVAADGGAGKTNYVLSDETSGVGFYKATAAGAYLPAHRAYLSTAAGGAGARSFLGFDDDETTGLGDAVLLNDNGQAVDGREVYDLQGRRVAQPRKGLYIVNGTKVVVR